MRRIVVLAIVILLASSLAYAGDMKPVKPAQKDKCPVCGMFVAKYPDFGFLVTGETHERVRKEAVDRDGQLRRLSQ